MDKERILITGGSGFIGTNLIEFYKDKHEVVNIDIEPPRNAKHKNFWQKTDILNRQQLLDIFTDFAPTYVYHMAARTDLNGPDLEAYLANTKGVENIISAVAKINSIKKVVFASSRLVCEIGYNPKDEFDYKPSTIYGESKIIGEKIIRDSKILNKNWVIVRPTSLWGPWFDIPYKTFFDTIRKGVYFHPKGIDIYKKFGYVENCVYILDKLLNNADLDYKTVYLSDFKTLNVKEWADIISKLFHNKKTATLPYTLLKLLAFSGDVLKRLGLKNPPLTTFRLNNIVTTMDYDTKRVEALVGALPFNLESATEVTYNWYRKQIK